MERKASYWYAFGQVRRGPPGLEERFRRQIVEYSALPVYLGKPWLWTNDPAIERYVALHENYGLQHGVHQRDAHIRDLLSRLDYSRMWKNKACGIPSAWDDIDAMLLASHAILTTQYVLTEIFGYTTNALLSVDFERAHLPPQDPEDPEVRPKWTDPGRELTFTVECCHCAQAPASSALHDLNLFGWPVDAVNAATRRNPFHHCKQDLARTATEAPLRYIRDLCCVAFHKACWDQIGPTGRRPPSLRLLIPREIMLFNESFSFSSPRFAIRDPGVGQSYVWECCEHRCDQCLQRHPVCKCYRHRCTAKYGGNPPPTARCILCEFCIWKYSDDSPKGLPMHCPLCLHPAEWQAPRWNSAVQGCFEWVSIPQADMLGTSDYSAPRLGDDDDAAHWREVLQRMAIADSTARNELDEMLGTSIASAKERSFSGENSFLYALSLFTKPSSSPESWKPLPENELERFKAVQQHYYREKVFTSAQKLRNAAWNLEHYYAFRMYFLRRQIPGAHPTTEQFPRDYNCPFFPLLNSDWDNVLECFIEEVLKGNFWPVLSQQEAFVNTLPAQVISELTDLYPEILSAQWHKRLRSRSASAGRRGRSPGPRRQPSGYRSGRDTTARPMPRPKTTIQPYRPHSAPAEVRTEDPVQQLVTEHNCFCEPDLHWACAPASSWQFLPLFQAILTHPCQRTWITATQFVDCESLRAHPRSATA